MQHKILAVDDNPTNILLYEELLEDDYVLETAESGEEAIEVVGRFNPDLILLDIMMPGIDGYEVARKLREDPGNEGIKIILVSARNQTTDRLVGYESGADDYLTKPFDEQELRAKLNVFLQLKSVEELDNLKTGVMGLFSHETRTPLNGILGPVQMLCANNDSFSAEERLKWLGLIETSATNLLRFIERTLLLADLHSGTTPLNTSDEPIAEVLQNSVEACRADAEGKGVTLTLTQIDGSDNSRQEVTPESLPHQAAIDRKLIQQSLSALIDNAIRHSESGTEVAISVATQESQCEIAVTDAGTGIPAEQLEHIFESFSRVRNSDSADGQCLSLAIAHEVVNLHKGKLAASSEPGQGSEFTITLPLAA